MIKQGDKGKAVVKIQKALLSRGLTLPKWGVDGDFGAETKSAVLSFQTQEGLSRSSVVDGVTAAFLLNSGGNGAQGISGPQGPQGPKGDTPSLVGYTLQAP